MYWKIPSPYRYTGIYNPNNTKRAYCSSRGERVKLNVRSNNFFGKLWRLKIYI